MEQPFFVSWYLTKRVIYARLHRQLENEEPAQIDQKFCEMLDEGEHVYLIMDLRDIAEMKKPSVTRLDDVKYRHHPHLQWMLILTNNQLMRFLSSTASQVAHKSHHIFSDIEELKMFMKKQFPDTDWRNTLFDSPI